MTQPIPIRKPENAAFYSFSMTFDDAAVQGLFALGLSREEIVQRVMESVAEAVWAALPSPTNKPPS